MSPIPDKTVHLGGSSGSSAADLTVTTDPQALVEMADGDVILTAATVYARPDGVVAFATVGKGRVTGHLVAACCIARTRTATRVGLILRAEPGTPAAVCDVEFVDQATLAAAAKPEPPMQLPAALQAAVAARRPSAGAIPVPTSSELLSAFGHAPRTPEAVVDNTVWLDGLDDEED